MGRARAAPASASRPSAAAKPKAKPKDPPCQRHDFPDGWRVKCALVSQLVAVTVATVLYCLPIVPKAAVPMLISGFFHLRVVQREGDGPDGELRVLFTDLIKSFDMKNTGWKPHLKHRFPDACKIRVRDGDKGHNEYVSLSLDDFAQFVRWSNGLPTDNPARDASDKTTFQKSKPRHIAARIFMRQVRHLLSAFDKLPQSAGSPSLSAFLLGQPLIRKATFDNGGLYEVSADGSAGASLALTAFQKELQWTVPEEKEQRQSEQIVQNQINQQQTEADGPSPHCVSKPKVKAVQVGPQIGNKKQGGGKQRDRAPAAVEAEQPQEEQPQHQPDDHPLAAASSTGEQSADGDDDDDAFNGEEDEDGGDNSDLEGDEEENEEDEGAAPLPAPHNAQWWQDTGMGLTDNSDSQLPSNFRIPLLWNTCELPASMDIHSAHQQQHQFQHPEQMGQQQHQQHQHSEQMGQQQQHYPLHSIGDHLQPSASARSSPSFLPSADHGHTGLQGDLSATRFDSSRPPSPSGHFPASPSANGAGTPFRPYPDCSSPGLLCTSPFGGGADSRSGAVGRLPWSVPRGNATAIAAHSYQS